MEIVGSPAEKVVEALKNLGFGPGDLDLGIEVIEAIEAFAGTPMAGLRKKTQEEESRVGGEPIEPTNTGVAVEVGVTEEIGDELEETEIQSGHHSAGKATGDQVTLNPEVADERLLR